MVKRLLDPEVMIEIDVIQVQQGKKRRIAARPRKVRVQVRKMKFGYQRFRDQPAHPFVEIASTTRGPERSMARSRSRSTSRIAC